jgi:hypothetical protein
MAVAAKTQGPTANDLRYQLSFNELARQCSSDGQTVRIRAGVQGRATIGPAGAPAQISVPVRFAVVKEGVEPRLIITRFRRQTVAVPPGAPSVDFTIIEEDLAFPMPSLSDLHSYVIYVGFDEAGDQPQRPPPRAKGNAKGKKR